MGGKSEDMVDLPFASVIKCGEGHLRIVDNSGMTSAFTYVRVRCLGATNVDHTGVFVFITKLVL